MNHGLERLASLPVSVRLIRRNPCQAAARRARFTPDTRQNCAPAKIGSARPALHPERGKFRPASADRCTKSVGRAGAFPACRGLVTIADQNRLGARAIRNLIHRFPRWKQARRTPADYIPALRRNTCSISRSCTLALLQASSAKLLRSPAQAVRDARAFEEWLEFFLTGVLEVSLEANDRLRAASSRFVNSIAP